MKFFFLTFLNKRKKTSQKMDVSSVLKNAESQKRMNKILANFQEPISEYNARKFLIDNNLDPKQFFQEDISQKELGEKTVSAIKDVKTSVDKKPLGVDRETIKEKRTVDDFGFSEAENKTLLENGFNSLSEINKTNDGVKRQKVLLKMRQIANALDANSKFTRPKAVQDSLRKTFSILEKYLAVADQYEFFDNQTELPPLASSEITDDFSDPISSSSTASSDAEDEGLKGSGLQKGRSCLKMKKNGQFGKVFISLEPLKQGRLVVKEANGNVLMEKIARPDLVFWLTKRFNPNNPISEESRKTLLDLINFS